MHLSRHSCIDQHDRIHSQVAAEIKGVLIGTEERKEERKELNQSQSKSLLLQQDKGLLHAGTAPGFNKRNDMFLQKGNKAAKGKKVGRLY